MDRYKKKHRKLIMLVQIIVIFYASIVSVSLLTNNTVAYYSSKSTVNTPISTASDWWDGSKLKFLGNGNEVIKSCSTIEISAEIKNKGKNMSKGTEYEVYYSSQEGNAKKHGEHIGDGIIPPLENGESTELSYEANEEGWYVFKAYQSVGYNDNYDERSVIWSKEFKIKCIENKQPKEEKETNETEDNIEGKDKEVTESEEQDDTNRDANHETDEETDSSDQTEESLPEDERLEGDEESKLEDGNEMEQGDQEEEINSEDVEQNQVNSGIEEEGEE
ncbi:amyloid fiber anchoring/assembly protein TapA [Ornithinibacillus halophilus]|uniref:amyloid fiber anchoring/assembly protein TapA n=1 Tax=Ornithinibacillus halophilus TaxID=930117 RepID=UPI000934A94C|nr:amyloid fiber anchoring/assembly protein TapA [Ornithinibacillus halophilus]